MIIDFNIANSRLTYTSQTDNGQIQTQLRFSFDDGWTGLIKTAVFVPSTKTAPLSICLDSENSCFATAEAAGDYKMYIVGTDSTENIAVTTNAVDVTLTQGNVIVIPPSTTAALIDELNADAASIKSDVSAAAQAAETLTKAAKDYESYKSEIDTAVATKANQSDVDTINKALAGVYKKGGDVDRMTLNLPITDKSLINTVYNVIKKDWIGDYSELGGYFQFKYLCTMKNVEITKNGDSCYIICSVSDIPSELYHRSFGNFTLNSGLGSICLQAGGTYHLFEYDSYSGYVQSEVLTFAYSGSQWGPALTDDYFASNFKDNVWEIGNTTVAWKVNNISTDDNFAIIENGFDVLSCKITDYITKYQFNSLSATVAKKANQSDVDTKISALQTDINTTNSNITTLQTGLTELRNGKANVADVYTKTETDSAISALQAEIDGTGKYDTIIDYTYTGEESSTELNILLTVEQLQKIKKYEKFFCYITYNVSATTGTTSFWATATLNLCTKGTTTLLSYGGIFMRAANTIQKITADNTPITWISTTDKVRLPDSDICITNVLDYGGTQYNLFNISTLTGGSSRIVSSILYQHSETDYDWVMQLKSPTAMPFTNGMKFIMWGK